jgi:hypothetical protein
MYVYRCVFLLPSFSATLYMWCVCACPSTGDKAKGRKGKIRYDRRRIEDSSGDRGQSYHCHPWGGGSECSLAGSATDCRVVEPVGRERENGRNTLGSESGTARDLEIRDCTLTSPASQPTKRRTHRYGRTDRQTHTTPPSARRWDRDASRCVAMRTCPVPRGVVWTQRILPSRAGRERGKHPIRCIEFSPSCILPRPPMKKNTSFF